MWEGFEKGRKNVPVARFFNRGRIPPTPPRKKPDLSTKSGFFQFYSPAASFIALQLYSACAEWYCAARSFGGEYNITLRCDQTYAYFIHKNHKREESLIEKNLDKSGFELRIICEYSNKKDGNWRWNQGKSFPVPTETVFSWLPLHGMV